MRFLSLAPSFREATQIEVILLRLSRAQIVPCGLRQSIHSAYFYVDMEYPPGIFCIPVAHSNGAPRPNSGAGTT